MSKLVLIFIFALFCAGMAGCTPQDTDTFCKTHTASEFVLRPQVVQVMNAKEKRNYLTILVEGSKLCGWRP
ncbi:hypothetical protein [Beijerinckia sp. L45]|uniref:hypothetical protein n=1 Tax=Beijerinckia sp. L45 TaxID=1641855 RepID=UPI00131CFCCF|nr:hypothetical protein [Beijerinckia sp. L45]